MRERIEFKCKVWNVEYKLVNAAYTSQTCHKCGEFGKRTGDIFECENCGKCMWTSMPVTTLNIEKKMRKSNNIHPIKK